MVNSGSPSTVLDRIADRIPDPNVVGSNVISNLNDTSVPNWGVIIKGVSLPKCDPKNSLSIAARELQFQEKQHRKGERIERAHILRMTSETAAVYVNAGMDPLDAILLARKDVRVQLDLVVGIDVEGGSAGDFTTAAALQRRQPRTQRQQQRRPQNPNT
jgi:hypothetical protein